MARKTVTIHRDVWAERRAAADRFRARMRQQGTLVVRLLSSPGSGKTTLLEETAKRLSAQLRIGVLVGDVETDRDAQRLALYAPSVEITTGGACHLELPLIERDLPKLGDKPFDILFIEDVGNLVCPASHDLGEHLRVILLSTTEGDDKPGKYPKAFRTADLLLLTKLDLLPHVPFSLENAQEDARKIQPEISVLSLSALNGEGLSTWCDYLQTQRSKLGT